MGSTEVVPIPWVVVSMGSTEVVPIPWVVDSVIPGVGGVGNRVISSGGGGGFQFIS